MIIMGIKSSKHTPPEDEASAGQLRRYYAAEINDFLDEFQVSRSSSRRRRDQSLNDLFDFAGHQYRDNQARAHQVTHLEEELQKLSTLHTKLEHMTRSQASEIQELEQDHHSQIEELRVKHNEQTEQLRYDHEVKIAELSSKHEAEGAEYDRRIEDMNSKQHQQITQLNDRHIRHTEVLDHDKRRLMGQLLVNQDDYQAWTDDKLKTKLGTLQRLIDLVTSPRNKEFIIPRDKGLSTDLDPHGFLARIPRGKSHLLLKSTIWSILCDELFSAPLGFGALGPDRGREELLALLSQFRGMFEKPVGSTASMTNDDIYALFAHNKMANNWRSATFQCIIAIFGEQHGDRSGSLLRCLGDENVAKASSRILAYLSAIAGRSSSYVSIKVKEDVQQLVNLAREIAMQFGVNTSRLEVCVPNRGDKLQIGDVYQDCENGDGDRGQVLRLDLLVVPGIQKIGDGRKDPTAQSTIVPCEFYPEE
ncbi:hypothetical protein BJ170DRAFT_624443 [Xylariales sp. AK1849]|nr:hypothetical protein BJ170DRAFT_624443 [Xylariales sp. AK1849]